MNTTYHITLFGFEFVVNRVAFTIPIGNGWPVYWYGILISLGFLLALIYALRNVKRFNLDPDRLIDCVLVTTLFAIAGARAYYLIFEDGFSGLKSFFSIHDGGLAIYGGIIAAVIVGSIMCKIRKISILDTMDLASIGFLIGQAVGRWGNFFNQEAFGRYISGSYLPDWFGMKSEATAEFYYEGCMVHPCFLYESVWCLLGFILLHFLSKHRKFSGEILLGYGMWYGFGRFFIEGLRIDSLKIGDVRVSQVVSAVAFIVCATLMVILAIRHSRKDIPQDYTPLFETELIAEGVVAPETEKDADDEEDESVEEYDEYADEEDEDSDTDVGLDAEDGDEALPDDGQPEDSEKTE